MGYYNSSQKGKNIDETVEYVLTKLPTTLQDISEFLSALSDGKADTTYVNQKVADIVGSAPETLDALNELANALGNDPNFATTVANQIGNIAIVANEANSRSNEAAQNTEQSAQSATEALESAQNAEQSAQAAAQSASEAEVSAQSAEEIAQSVRDDADNGKFKGEQGDKGESGYTPQKGIDYWTEADKTEMTQEVAQYMAEQYGDIEKACDEIINLQNTLIGGETV